jgi:hypothetical protein
MIVPVIAALLFHAGGGGGPAHGSVAAANATAQQNALCKAVYPFYAEIGTKNQVLWSIQVGTSPPGRTTGMGIDSATKWAYSYYIAQIRGSLAAYTTADIQAFNMDDGYVNLGESPGGSSCPQSLNPRTPAQCILQSPGPNGQPGQAYGAQVTDQGPGSPGVPGASAVGAFFYQGGHDMVHGVNHSPLFNLTDPQISVAIGNQVGVVMAFTQPLLSGGIATSTANYATMLQNMLNNSYYLTSILPSTDTICTDPGGNYSNQTVGGVPGPTNCPAQYSPIPELWQYGLGFWKETDPAVNGDGAYSSPGSDGYYPWIDVSETFYGVLARASGGGNGYPSAQCGRLIRRAWITGTQQTGTIPTP